MAKDGKPLSKDDFQFIQLETMNLPVYKENKTTGLIDWGKLNNYPTELISLANNHPIHGAILKGKTRYLVGLDLKAENPSPIVEAFLAKANKKESWFELSKKVKADRVQYGGYVIKVSSNLAGQPLYFEHLDMGKMRVDNAYAGMWYSDDWDAKKRTNFNIDKKYYPFYKDGFVGESIIYFKEHNPSVSKIDDCYPIPEYSSVILDISTDIEISKFFNSLVKNGFSAGHIITFFSGELKPEVKKDIVDRFQKEYQGPDGRRVALIFANKEGKGAEIVNVDSNNLDKQYQELNKRNQQNIISGHNVPAVLFKIKSEGQLGERNEIDLAYELMMNEYVMPCQLDFNEIVRKFCKIRTGVDTKFFVEQFKPVNKELDLSNANVVNALNALNPKIITDYIIKQYGLTIPEGSNEIAPVKQSEVNEHIKNLTGRQKQNLLSIVNKYQKGTYTQEQALMLIKTGFGLSDEEANSWLGIKPSDVQMSALDKEQMFVSFMRDKVIEIDEEDELLREDIIDFSSVSDVKMYENVLLAKDEKDKNFINRVLDFFTPKKNESGRTEEYEFYTVYKYGLRPDQKGTPLVKDTTREFCREMVALTSGKKRLTFEAINSFTNEFGENAWDFRGGFYTKKGTNNTTPWCRHAWIAETRKRKNNNS